MKKLRYSHDGTCWVWKIQGENGKVYYTNNYGDGIFCDDYKHGKYNQLTGTCQFSIRGLKNPRRKIRQWMIDHYLLEEE